MANSSHIKGDISAVYLNGERVEGAVVTKIEYGGRDSGPETVGDPAWCQAVMDAMNREISAAMGVPASVFNLPPTGWAGTIRPDGQVVLTGVQSEREKTARPVGGAVVESTDLAHGDKS